jgi:excisionase family DNA binding protein
MTDADRLELEAELAELDRLPVYLTRAEAADYLRVNEATIDRALERGDLARRRVGGRTLVPRASLRAWVLRQAGVDLDAAAHNVFDLSARLGAPKPRSDRSTP